MNRDPVCGKKINPNKAYITIKYEGENYCLCCPLCQREFERDPRKYVKLNQNSTSRKK